MFKTDDSLLTEEKNNKMGTGKAACSVLLLAAVGATAYAAGKGSGSDMPTPVNLVQMDNHQVIMTEDHMYTFEEMTHHGICTGGLTDTTPQPPAVAGFNWIHSGSTGVEKAWASSNVDSLESCQNACRSISDSWGCKYSAYNPSNHGCFVARTCPSMDRHWNQYTSYEMVRWTRDE